MKKILLFFPAFLMLVLPVTATADDFLRGDCNLDNKVNISDVTTLIDYLLGGKWTEEDVNGDTLLFTVNDVSFKMVRVNGGTFTMGATAEQAGEYNSNEQPAHEVTLSPYYICTTEVTQELWLAVMGSNPSYFVGNNLPVERVTWDDCQDFLDKLCGLSGRQFRLPTEAEWEYAARGGEKSRGYKYSGSDNVDTVAWYKSNACDRTCPVASKEPNELGLYDMSGNVWEWCQDWFDNYANASAVDPQGPVTGYSKVLRGGSWYDASTYQRVSYRLANPTTQKDYNRGLRLAL